MFVRFKFGIGVMAGMCMFASACRSDSNPEAEPRTRDDAQAKLVVEGSPWTFDSYELLQVRERNGSPLSDEEIGLLAADIFADVIITFESDGGGSETGFDPIPSRFLWKLNSGDNVVFLDQNGNEFESPLGRMEVDVIRQLLQFTSQQTTLDPESGMEIVFYGTVTFKGAF